MYDPDSIDAIKSQPLEGDGALANITAYQAQKCAAILEAYYDGQALYLEHVNTVAQFLKAAALEGSFGLEYARPSSQLVWQYLEHLSWPRHGGAQPQGD